jgi:hypothetical protein
MKGALSDTIQRVLMVPPTHFIVQVFFFKKRKNKIYFFKVFNKSMDEKKYKS